MTVLKFKVIKLTLKVIAVLNNAIVYNPGTPALMHVHTHFCSVHT